MNKIRPKRRRVLGELKRVKQVCLRLTAAEYQLMQKNAEEAGVDLAVYARRLGLGGKVNARLSEEDRKLFRELVGMSNDLHQLMRLARDEGLEKAMTGFEAGRNAVDAILNRLKL
jgi:hypothetical protein